MPRKPANKVSSIPAPSKSLDQLRNEASEEAFEAAKKFLEEERAKTPEPPAPPPPQPPSEAVLIFQKQIVELVTARDAVQRELAAATQRVSNAAAEQTYWSDRMKFLEQEVQYRLGLIGQMEGRPVSTVGYPAPQVSFPLPGGPSFSYVAPLVNDAVNRSFAGVSSIPAPQPNRPAPAPYAISIVGGHEVNTGAVSEEERRAL